jgi:hypothetical protein
MNDDTNNERNEAWSRWHEAQAQRHDDIMQFIRAELPDMAKHWSLIDTIRAYPYVKLEPRVD